MKDRIRQLIESKPYKNGEFAELLGINPAGISHILSGRNNPGYDLLKKILIRFPNVSADWLLLGEGPMLRENSTTPAPTMSDTAPSAQEQSKSVINATTTPAPELWSSPSVSPQPSTPQPSNTPKSTIGKIARIVIFYEDGTFNSYTPENQ